MKLTIFDLDNTILRGDSDYSWIEFLIEKEIVDVKKYKDKNLYESLSAYGVGFHRHN